MGLGENLICSNSCSLLSKETSNVCIINTISTKKGVMEACLDFFIKSQPKTEETNASSKSHDMRAEFLYQTNVQAE